MFGIKKITFEAITPQQGEQRIREGNPLVIDVREPNEYAMGHIAGSKLIPLGQLSSKLDALGAKDQEIIVVCQSGARSNYAASILAAAGFNKVADLKGGMSNWTWAGLPVQK
jgi:rhodanese-related sulfurtransferase